jgi:hypothetical protein
MTLALYDTVEKVARSGDAIGMFRDIWRLASWVDQIQCKHEINELKCDGIVLSCSAATASLQTIDPGTDEVTWNSPLANATSF